MFCQHVKKGKTAKSPEEFSQSYRVPETVQDRIRLLRSLNCNLKVLNYSRGVILPRVMEWLGVPLECSEKVDRVNRSLTSSEIEVLRQMTARGINVAKIGNSLCRKVAVQRQPIGMEPAALEDFANRMGVMASRVNRILPESERYTVPCELTKYRRDDRSIILSPEQMSVILNGITR
jgi:hypothetical protein